VLAFLDEISSRFSLPSSRRTGTWDQLLAIDNVSLNSLSILIRFRVPASKSFQAEAFQIRPDSATRSAVF